MTAPRILTLDIETAPAVAEVFSLWDSHVPIHRVRRPGYVLGIGWKWYDRKTVNWASTFTDGSDGLAEVARGVLDEADIVITYNGDKFDIGHLNKIIALEGLTPPSPIKSIDLYKTVKRQFKFESNKLDFVAQQLGVGSKIKTEYDLWRACMEDDERAWAKMARYCKKDVKLTENLYDKIRPWIRNHPNLGLWHDSAATSCPHCASTNVTKNGTRSTVTVTYQRFQCQDCGAWFRGTDILARAGGYSRIAN